MNSRTTNTIPRKPRLATPAGSTGRPSLGRRVGRLDVGTAGVWNGAELGVLGEARGPVEDPRAPIAAKPTSWLRDAVGRCPCVRNVDVELAVRQCGRPEDRAERGAVRQSPLRQPPDRSTTVDRERLLPGRRVHARRRDVEHGVGDADGALAEGGVRRHDGDAGRPSARRDSGSRSARAPRRARAPSGRASRRGTARLRTRSRYSRRATIPAFGQERVAAGHQAASSQRRPVRSRHRRTARPTCSMKSASSDGSATSKWVTVEPPRTSGAARTASGSTPARELELGAGRRRIGDRATPGSRSSQSERSSPVDARAGPSARRSTASGRASVPPATSRPWSTIATRLAQRLGGLHLVGREDERPALVAQLEERLAQQRRG